MTGATVAHRTLNPLAQGSNPWSPISTNKPKTPTLKVFPLLTCNNIPWGIGSYWVLKDCIGSKFGSKIGSKIGSKGLRPGKPIEVSTAVLVQTDLVAVLVQNAPLEGGFYWVSCCAIASSDKLTVSTNAGGNRAKPWWGTPSASPFNVELTVLRPVYKPVLHCPIPLFFYAIAVGVVAGDIFRPSVLGANPPAGMRWGCRGGQVGR